jgi:hypothetical protein
LFIRAAKTDRRGFVLITVLVLALLFFAMMELMLIESTQAMRGATRYRARVMAQAMAENAVELVAHDLLNGIGKSVTTETEDGLMSGTLEHFPDGTFRITAFAETAGALTHRATVEVRGTVSGPEVVVTRTRHSQ